MSVTDYAASGNTTVGGISVATGMAPSSVDNAMRKIVDDIGEGLANGYFATALPATKTANYTVLTTDRGKLFNCTSALTLALPVAATAAAGFMFWVKANGAAVILDPNAAELIDGAATVTIASGSSAFVVCTGSAWVTAFVATSYDWAAAVVAASAKATPIDADSIGLVDSAAANVLKEVTIAQLKAVVLASPTLTGTPVAPTQTAADNSTKIATTAYSDAAATAAAAAAVAALNYGAANAALAYGGIGTYVFAYEAGANLANNGTVAGSTLQPAGFQIPSGGLPGDDSIGASATSLIKGSTALSGTWRVMGRATTSAANGKGTLFLRIS